nr:MAG TPA: hypothetical protein [Caudoviricetes sp.]
MNLTDSSLLNKIERIKNLITLDRWLWLAVFYFAIIKAVTEITAYQM